LQCLNLACAMQGMRQPGIAPDVLIVTLRCGKVLAHAFAILRTQKDNFLTKA